MPGDARATASHLAGGAIVARIDVVFELAAVATQALAAVWFYKLVPRMEASAAGTRGPAPRTR